jgi:hypothetical protein
MLIKPKIEKFSLAVVFFSLMAILIPTLESRADDAIFDKYASETCHQTITYYHWRKVTYCSNGAFKRYDYLGSTQGYYSYGRQYCDGGWGWCISGDADCGPEETFQDVIDEYVCE